MTQSLLHHRDSKSTAKTATPIANGQKLSLAELFTGPYCRTLKHVPGRPALTYRGPPRRHRSVEAGGMICFHKKPEDVWKSLG